MLPEWGLRLFAGSVGPLLPLGAGLYLYRRAYSTLAPQNSPAGLVLGDQAIPLREL